MEVLLETFYAGKTIDKDHTNILLTYLKKFSVEDILFEIEQSLEETEPIGKNNISQFSNIEVIDYVVQIVSDAAEEVNGKYIGYMLNKNSSEGAQSKYGGNHLSMAIQMGLVSKKPYQVTELGKQYMALSENEKRIVKPKLYLRVPIVQRLLLDSKKDKVDAMNIMRKYLAESTAVRRRTNIKTLISEIEKISSTETQKQIMDNVIWS